jgi:hypothetical protein
MRVRRNSKPLAIVPDRTKKSLCKLVYSSKFLAAVYHVRAQLPGVCSQGALDAFVRDGNDQGKYTPDPFSGSLRVS